MCFWQENILNGVHANFRGHHLSHCKHLNQDYARAFKRQFKNRPYIELIKGKKKPYILHVSFGSQWWRYREDYP